MTLKGCDNSATDTGTLRRIDELLTTTPETRRNCARRYEIDYGHRPGIVASDASLMAELERGDREPRPANATLRSAPDFFGTQPGRSQR